MILGFIQADVKWKAFYPPRYYYVKKYIKAHGKRLYMIWVYYKMISA